MLHLRGRSQVHPRPTLQRGLDVNSLLLSNYCARCGDDPGAALDAERDAGAQLQGLPLGVLFRVQAEGEAPVKLRQGNDGFLEREAVADALAGASACIMPSMLMVRRARRRAFDCASYIWYIFT